MSETVLVALKPTGGTEEAEHYDTVRKGVYTVTAHSGLRMRTGPGNDKTVIELLPKGTEVYSQGFYTGPWIRVETDDSRVGFCHTDYLEKE